MVVHLETVAEDVNVAKDNNKPDNDDDRNNETNGAKIFQVSNHDSDGESVSPFSYVCSLLSRRSKHCSLRM